MVLRDREGLGRRRGVWRVNNRTDISVRVECMADLLLLPGEGVLGPVYGVAFHDGVCPVVPALAPVLHAHGVFGVVETLLLGSVGLLFGHDGLLAGQLAALENVASLLLGHEFDTLFQVLLDLEVQCLFIDVIDLEEVGILEFRVVIHASD